MSGLVYDLISLTLEVTNLAKARDFYTRVLGLQVLDFNEQDGTCTLQFSSGQQLELWMPITRQFNSERLAGLGARGGTHVHWAMQIPKGTLQEAKQVLIREGIAFQEVNLSQPDQEPDVGLYFWDPFFHGLELREIDLTDPRFPIILPGKLQEGKLPVVGLREVALAFQGYLGMKHRLPDVYGFSFLKEMHERAFCQFTLAPEPEPDGMFTPRRWLYAWDPQVGIADMLGGEHVTVKFLADPDPIEERVREAGLQCFRDEHGLVVKDTEGHTFEFVSSWDTGGDA